MFPVLEKGYHRLDATRLPHNRLCVGVGGEMHERPRGVALGRRPDLPQRLVLLHLVDERDKEWDPSAGDDGAVRSLWNNHVQQRCGDPVLGELLPALGKLDKSVDTADVHDSRMVPLARRNVHEGFRGRLSALGEPAVADHGDERWDAAESHNGGVEGGIHGEARKGFESLQGEERERGRREGQAKKGSRL